MKNIFKNSTYTIILALTLFGFAGSTFAQTPPAVAEFQSKPLFSEVNFVPGNSVSRTVTFNNTDPASDSVAHSAIVNAKDVVNSGSPKLSDAMELTIKDGSTVLYDDTFTNFFAMSEVVLSQVPAGLSSTFDFVVTFKSESGNEYQNSTMSFTLEAGLADVGTTDDNTISIGGEQSSGGGSTGGANGPIVIGKENLIISGENVTGTNPPQAGEAVVRWNTNLLSTSQVIYGLVSKGPYNLDLTGTNFGYTYMTAEQDLSKVTSHSVLLSGIEPEKLYSYRVISRASPPTVGYEYTFMLGADGVVRTNSPVATVFEPTGAQTGGQTGAPAGAGGAGIGAGQNAGGANEFSVGTGAASSTIAGGNGANANQNQLAAAFLGAGLLSWKNILWLIIALLLLFLLILLWKRRKEKN